MILNFSKQNFMLIPRILVFIPVFFLAGCGWNPFSFLASNKDDLREPAELVKFDEEVRLRKVWSKNVGKGQGKRFHKLKPAIEGGLIYAASTNGIVMALDRESGRESWRVNLKKDISGGVGIGDNMVLLGTINSTVLALNADNGETLWESEVTSEVLSRPVTDDGIVVVQSIDGKITGLDASNGEQVWIYENTVPALTLRGTSSPLISGNFVIVAFANGSVASLALEDGTLRWEERVAIPTGRSEIDRIVDIDGDLYVNENGLLVVPSYQGYMSVINLLTGQTVWRTQESSSVGASSGFGNLYICDEDDLVKAYKTGEDDIIWSNESLFLRKLTAPATFGNYVAVADFEGYVHLLAQVDGRVVGRTRADSKGVRASLIARNNFLYVYGNSGNLIAYTVR